MKLSESTIRIHSENLCIFGPLKVAGIQGAIKDSALFAGVWSHKPKVIVEVITDTFKVLRVVSAAPRESFVKVKREGLWYDVTPDGYLTYPRKGDFPADHAEYMGYCDSCDGCVLEEPQKGCKTPDTHWTAEDALRRAG